MKVIVITSSNLRHMAYAKMVCDNLKIDLLVIENKRYPNQSLFKKEREYFKNVENWKPPAQILKCEKGKINDKTIVSFIKEIQPDVILTFGCSLLKKRLFEIPKKGCINIHTGIVQLFRGVDSSFWAIHDEKPEGIGATLHYIDKSIDAGEIIDQKQIDIDKDDDLNDLFLKSCIAGFDILKKNLKKIKNDKINTHPLKSKGKLYNSRDRTKDAEKRVNKKLKRVLQEYVGKKND